MTLLLLGTAVLVTVLSYLVAARDDRAFAEYCSTLSETDE